VLNIDAVVRILALFDETGDWAAALEEAVPKRIQDERFTRGGRRKAFRAEKTGQDNNNAECNSIDMGEDGVADKREKYNNNGAENRGERSVVMSTSSGVKNTAKILTTEKEGEEGMIEESNSNDGEAIIIDDHNK